MTKLIVILLSAVFVNNYVLSRFLGICPFLGVSKKLDSATGMSLAVIFVMLMATAATWPIQMYLLVPNHLEYLQTIVFILVIAALVQLVEIVLKRYIPSLHKSLGVYLPLITTNCVVLGVAIQVVTNEYNFGFAEGARMLGLGESLIFAIATAIGYGLALILFAGIREQLELSNVPKGFKGVPIALLTAGIMALAFMGFSGLV